MSDDKVDLSLTPNRTLALVAGIFTGFLLWYQGVLIHNDTFDSLDIIPQNVSIQQKVGFIFFIASAVLYWFKLITVFGPELGGEEDMKGKKLRK